MAVTYQNALKKNLVYNSNQHLNFDLAQNCDTGLEKINQYRRENRKPDVVFLDTEIDEGSCNKNINGENLGLEISNYFPDIKLVILTSLQNNYKIHHLITKLNPCSFTLKKDLTDTELSIIIGTIKNNSVHYSKSVLQMFRKQMSSTINLDEFDRKLLYQLSKGTKTKDLPNILFLSIAGIEKRKRKLKQQFNVTSRGNTELLNAAKEKGFI
jgi:DNA-binding NarL/FixJ family response regulator